MNEFLVDYTEDSNPVFIVGMNGSGTTMLADSLGHHPDLYILPLESKVLPHFIEKQADFGDLSQLSSRRRLADAIGHAKAYWQTNDKRDLVLPDSALQSPGFAAVVDAVYKHFAEKAGKRRWGDKSPINTQYLRALGAAFPRARFVHIIRDGRDAAQSFHRRWGYYPKHTILRWKRVVETGIRQGAELGPSRYLQVFYESLTKDPENEMKRVCEFLDLRFDESVLKSSMHFMDPDAKRELGGAIIQNSDKWTHYFSPKQVAAMEDIAGAMLDSLGYSVSYLGSADPPRALLRLWWLRDRLVFTGWFFRRYGFLALPGYLRHLQVALRQWQSTKH